MNQSQLYDEAYKFILYKFRKAFEEKQWLLLKNQFPKVHQSQIILKILSRWKIVTGKLQGTIQNLFQIASQQIFAFKELFSMHSGPHYHVWDSLSEQQGKKLDPKKYKGTPKYQLHRFIQFRVKRVYPHGPYSSYRKAFNYMRKNNIPLNEANLIKHGLTIDKHPRLFDIQSQISEKDEKIFNQLNSKCRIFKQRQIQQKQNQEFQKQKKIILKKIEKQKNKKTFQEKQQQLICRKFIVEQYMGQGANFIEDQSDSDQFSVQIQKPQCQQIQQRKRRILKKNRKIEDIGAVGLIPTYLTHQNKKYHFCSKCYAVVRNDSVKLHKCQKEKEKIFVQKSQAAESYFLPIYRDQKTTYGLCLNCKVIANKYNHRFQKQFEFQLKFFSRINPIYKVQDRIQFSKIDMIRQHFGVCHLYSDELNFYQQFDLGKIPEMFDSPQKIRLVSEHVLSAFEQIPQGLIFGPIGIDVLPISIKDCLPWHIKYFANKVCLNYVECLIAPLIRYNGAGYMCNIYNSSGLPNIFIFAGYFNYKISLFAKAIRKIKTGEQLIIKDHLIMD